MLSLVSYIPLVPEVGFEPTYNFIPQGLSLLRLPFRHSGIWLLNRWWVGLESNQQAPLRARGYGPLESPISADPWRAGQDSNLRPSGSKPDALVH